MSFRKYSAYRDSGIEWLGEVPRHWEVKKFKWIVSIPITDGPHETPEFIEQGVPFVSAEAVSSGYIDFEKIRGFISREDHARYSLKYEPQLNDIFMVKSGATTGITAMVTENIEFNIWSPLAVIRCGREAVPLFVLSFMRSRPFLEVIKLSWNFGTQQNIGMGVLEELFCVQPPLIEQTAIGTYLDLETAKIDDLVAEKERLIKLLKEKRQALISHAVTKGLDPNVPMKDSGVEWLGEVPQHWDIVPIKYIGLLRGGAGFPIEEQGKESEEIPFFKVNSLAQSEANGMLRFFEHSISQATARKLGAYIFPKGTIVFAKVGAALLLGRIRILGHASCIDNNMMGLEIRQDLFFLGFVQYALQLVRFDYISNPGTVPSLNEQQIGCVLLAMPCFIEQKVIAAHLERESAKIDSLIADSTAAIDLLKEKRQALISAVVTGKVDVRHLVEAL